MQKHAAYPKVSEAIPLGNEVAQAVGKQYEQTGQLPSQGEVDAIVQNSAHRSRFVSGVALANASGTLTLRLTATPRGDGFIQFVPGSDNNRHLSWT